MRWSNWHHYIALFLINPGCDSPVLILASLFPQNLFTCLNIPILEEPHLAPFHCNLWKPQKSRFLCWKELQSVVLDVLFSLVWNFYPFLSSISNKIVTIMKEKVTLCGEVLTWHNTWLEAPLPPLNPLGSGTPPTVTVRGWKPTYSVRPGAFGKKGSGIWDFAL